MKKAIFIILLLVVAIVGYMFWKKKKASKPTKIIPLYDGTPIAQTGGIKPPHNTGVKTYKVKKGDTLSKIAHAFGVSLSALVGANPQISNPNLIYPGQVINIP